MNVQCSRPAICSYIFLKLQVLLAWFKKSTTSDFTIQDLIREIKTWFTEGYLYDEVWEKLGERVDPEVLPSDAEVKAMIKKRRHKRISSSFRQAVGHPITRNVLTVLVAITIGCCEFH